MYTPIEDQTKKNELIEHLNDDHPKEIRYTAMFYSKHDVHKASIEDIFEEGIAVTIIDDNQQAQKLFVPFDTKGTMEEKVLFLSYTAMLKMGVAPSSAAPKYFEVVDTSMVSANMFRITIQSQQELSDKPAFAYKFALKKLDKRPANHKQNKKKNIFSEKFMLFMLWIMKKLSTERRSSMMKKMERGLRFYTLTDSWKGDNSEFLNMGYIDVLLHGNSPGSEWARSLAKGSIIKSMQEYDHVTKCIHLGQSCIIVDETGYPALFGILKKWHHEHAPIVVIVSQQEGEQKYFDEEILSVAKQVITVSASIENQAESIIEAVQELNDIENTWGVLEKDVSKKVRNHFAETFSLTNKVNRISAYWRHE